MRTLLTKLFIKSWQKKLISLCAAITIWFLVNQTVTITRTIFNVPVRIINLLPDQTIIGLQTNGLLTKKVTLTITGYKTAIEDLRNTDLEVVINAEGHKDSWIASIDKRNLVSLNPDIDIKPQIKQVVTNDLLINLTKLVTAEIPIRIVPPKGIPPKGYQYLETWPKKLYQKTTGPLEQIEELKNRGLQLEFNLNSISEEELNGLYEEQDKREEVFFKVPTSWKKIPNPLNPEVFIPLNDPEAEFLRILFLKQELLPLGIKLPIFLFFPIKNLQKINPEIISLKVENPIYSNHGIYQLITPLFVKNVSRLFLDIVKNNLAMIITMPPSTNSKTSQKLNWAIECFDQQALEQAFVKATLEQNPEQHFKQPKNIDLSKEQPIRGRFQEYLRQVTLVNEIGVPLSFEFTLKNNEITIIENNMRITK